MTQSLSITGMAAGPLQTNCYLLAPALDGSGVPQPVPCWVVDPGGDSDLICGELDRRKLCLQAVLLTHTHFDHILGIQGLLDRYGSDIPVFAHPEGAVWLGSGGAARQRRMIEALSPGLASAFSRELSGLPEASIYPDRIPGTDLQVLPTPGHTPDSVSLYSPSGGWVCSGDTLFHQSVGRTDFPGGNSRTLAESIRTRLYTLPPETVVYPGHGDPTTIGAELRSNPFVRAG